MRPSGVALPQGLSGRSFGTSRKPWIRQAKPNPRRLSAGIWKAEAKGYWSGYLSSFDPKTVLEQSAWKMGEIKKDRAEIILRYRKSSNDAILKMYREEGSWKVGLDETFSTRQ
jgi:hypothetical protein